MSQAILAFPNYLTEGFTPTFSLGNWNSNFPLGSMLSMGTGKGTTRVRSTDATTASTQFKVTFDRDADMRVVSLVNHNLSKTATWRVLIANSVGTTLVDTGFVTANPALASFSSTYWAHPSLIDGLPDTYIYNSMVKNAIYVLSTVTAARSVTIFINDTGNTNGWVQFAGLFVGGGWKPSINMAIGANLAYEDQSLIQESYNNIEFIQKKLKRRIVTASWADIAQNEASTWYNLISLTLGNTGSAFLVWDPADTEKYLTHSFLCRIRELNALESAAAKLFTQSYKFSEVLT